MTFAEYLRVVADTMEDRTKTPYSYRMGQVYFNVLEHYRPRLANTLRGTIYDPFYNNDRIGEFVSIVCERWNDPLFAEERS